MFMFWVQCNIYEPQIFLYVVYGEVHTKYSLCKLGITQSRVCLCSLLIPLLLAYKHIGMLTNGRHNTMVNMGITLFPAEKLGKFVDLTNPLLCKRRPFHHPLCGTLPFLAKCNKTPFLEKRCSLFWGTITTETPNCPNTRTSKMLK
jgi:hypothetical protein